MSWQDFRLTCSILDLSVPAQHMSRNGIDKLTEVSKIVVERSMKISGENIYNSSTPTNNSAPNIRECTVNFDASWIRRGHFSNQGFAAAIDSEFGKVLYYALYDKVCYQCCKWPEEKQTQIPEEYQEFCKKHRLVHYQLLRDFSGHGVISCSRIWKRSINKHSLVYGTYIGDGDSSSFETLQYSDPYKGATNVRKEECLGHVHSVSRIV